MIVLHDFYDAIASHAAYYAELMEKHQLILVDMRGQHSMTPIGKDDTLTYKAVASDVNQLLEQLKIDSANILGFIAGAKVGLLMAKDYPKKVKKLLTYGLFIQTDSAAVNPLIFKQLEDRAKQTKEVQAKKVLDLILNKEANNISVSELSAIKTPVFLVSGDRGYIKKEHTLSIAKSLPNAQVRILPGSGQTIINVKNDAFLSIIKDFFGD